MLIILIQTLLYICTMVHDYTFFRRAYANPFGTVLIFYILLQKVVCCRCLYTGTKEGNSAVSPCPNQDSQ
uniref:Uncharacterized protein n=1 Tax=Triticum urartu TaxID=4572 RepID=A0A8R7TYE0_TRIUA